MHNVFLHKDMFCDFLGAAVEAIDSILTVVVGTHSREKYKRPDERLERACRMEKIPLVRVDNPTGEGCDRPFWLIMTSFAKRDGYVLASRIVARWPLAAYDY